jgi:hypothetical protein
MELQHSNHKKECNVATAVVVGNGTSRSGIVLKSLKTIGTVYACNAAYREFAPDYLIAVDPKMILEITKSQYHLNNSVWTNPNQTTKNLKNVNIFKPHLGWSSGPTALTFASSKKYDNIFILGFDYLGLGENCEFVNNVYAGTENYKALTAPATYYRNWLKQTETCIKNNFGINYYRVIDEKNDFIPEELNRLSNLIHINKQDFIAKFSLETI